MEKKAIFPTCQIYSLQQLHEPMMKIEMIWQLRNRIKHIIKRRLRYINHWFNNVTRKRGVTSDSKTPNMNKAFETGELVRVRSRKEIEATLDRWNRLKGCDIMEEMWKYCNTTQRVYKQVGQFLDERDYLVKKCNGIYILEGIFCDGTVDFGRCDRTCFYFWREEWLEKV